MFLLALESDNFSPFILEVPFGVNYSAERYANSAPVHYSIRIPKPQIPSTKSQGFRCRVSRLRSVELRRGKQVSGKKNKKAEF